MREEDPQEWWNARDKAADRLLDYFLPLRTPGLAEQERQQWAAEAEFWMHIGMLLEHATNATDPSDFRADVLVAHVIEDHELAEEEEGDTDEEDGLGEDEQITRRTRHLN